MKELPSRDIALAPEQNSYESEPLGFVLLIETSPEYKLLIDDNGNELVIA